MSVLPANTGKAIFPAAKSGCKRIRNAGSVIRDKHTPLFVYCYSGSRSAQATSVLKSMGYTNVNNIGGISGWRGKIEEVRL